MGCDIGTKVHAYVCAYRIPKALTHDVWCTDSYVSFTWTIGITMPILY